MWGRKKVDLIEKYVRSWVHEGVKITNMCGDITKQIGIITNAANEHLAHGGGVAGAISRAGGHEVDKQSRDWVKKNGKVNTGTCAYTGGGNMPCRYVIHAVGPIWHGGKDNEEKLLHDAIINTLLCAVELCKSIEKEKEKRVCIPAISSAIFGFPLGRNTEIFGESVFEFVHKMDEEDKTHLKEIVLCNIEPETCNMIGE